MPNTPESELHASPMELGVGSYDAFQQDVRAEPEAYVDLWARLSRVNPALALSLLDGSKHALESGMPADQAHTQGALDLLGALVKSEEARRLETAGGNITDTEEPEAEVFDLSWRRRLRERRERKHSEAKKHRLSNGIATTIGAVVVPFALLKSRAPNEEEQF